MPRSAFLLPLCAWAICVGALGLVRALGGGFWATNFVYGPAILLLPFWLVRNEPQPDPLGLRMRPLLPSLRLFAWLAAIALPAGAAYFALRLGAPSDVPGAWSLAWLALVQTGGVAFPEELFFRGYLQGRWAVARRKSGAGPFPVPGVRVGWEWPLAALAFGLTHLVNGGPAGLLTFFPGLLFGWAYARSGNIWTAVLLHGAANVLALGWTGSG